MHIINDFLLNLVPTVEHLGIWGYWVVLGFALLESLAIVGSIVPGGMVVVLAGFLSSQGYLHLGDLIAFAAVGAILGDSISYYLGTKGTQFFRNENRILKETHLDRGKAFFERHGNKSIFLGRFIPVLRPIVPFVAGLSSMNLRWFLVWNIFSGILWATTHVLLGYFFGGALQTVEIWSTRLGVFLVAVVAALSLIWFLVKHSGGFFRFVWSLLVSVGQGIWDNEYVKKIRLRYPRATQFFVDRFTIAEFSGLPLTLLTVVFLYLLVSLVGVVEDVVTSEAVVTVDIRFANLLLAFRHDLLINIFLWFTVLGSWQVVIIFGLLASLLFWLWHQRVYILALWFSIITNQLLVAIGKLALHKPRPLGLIPAYIEQSYAFPSGHAAIAVAFYGFLLYALWRTVRKWRYNLNATFVGIVCIVMIGFSRLYLGVHYLSDVVGGYLLGGMCLILSITMTEWWLSQHSKPVVALSNRRRLNLVTAGVAILAIVSYGLIGATYKPARNTATAETLPMILTSDIATVFSGSGLPQYTEGLSGSRQEPLSFIIAAKGESALVKAFTAAGWYRADEVTLNSIGELISSAIGNQPYPSAPMTPSFWNNQVNDFGFEKPTTASTVRQRHHARFWKTNIVTTDGQPVYVGTASFDQGLKWLITHSISPDIDTERDVLLHDLAAAGVIANSSQISFVQPTLGKNFSGESFFTDGKADVIYLK